MVCFFETSDIKSRNVVEKVWNIGSLEPGTTSPFLHVFLSTCTWVGLKASNKASSGTRYKQSVEMY